MLSKRTPILLALAIVAVQAQAAVPSQFIAKQYTEALGRAPDTTGWKNYTNYFASYGCSSGTLQTVAGSFFNSTEYKNKTYTPEEQVLTIYRALLSREPDALGFETHVNLLRAGNTLSQVIENVTRSQEFLGLVPGICSGNAYRQDWGMTQALDIGGGVWSQAQLQSCLDNNAVCSVPARTVVLLTSTVQVGAGKTLETAGGIDRTRYARQARLVRAGGSIDFTHMLHVSGGATVRNLWISGQRHLFKNVPQADGVRANIRFTGDTHGVLQGIRSDAALQRSHIETASSASHAGSILIENNLTTGYTSNHVADGTHTWVTDGLSVHTYNSTVRKNDIVDPTDVGIVIFGHDTAPQASVAHGNTIVHAGHSAYGSLGFDTLGCNGCGFSGKGIYGNTILAGNNQHSDIMLFVGTGAWGEPPDCVAMNRCGRGAMLTGNTTIWGDERQVTTVQVGIAVDGMLNATVSGNALHVRARNIGKCYVSNLAYDVSQGHASGNLQPGSVDHDTHRCIGHD